MPQLAQRLSFDLPNAFARYREAAAYLFQCVLRAVIHAESHPEYLLFARTESTQHQFGTFFEVDAYYRICR